ncbi:MAG: shikimate dehydrogenase [Hyphomonadaceae bacterium]
MTKRFAVIGDPVSHSLSPLMHMGWIKDHNLDATYEALLLRSDDPVAAIRNLEGFAGVNVTVPHKEVAAKAADRSEDAVANTLRWEADGTISAFNTDGGGFVDALDAAAPGWRDKAETAVIIGAGGAARGIAAALAGSMKIIIVNRTYPRAAELAAQFPKAGAALWPALRAVFSEADLIINATTLGMSGGDSPDWPVAWCRRGTLVVDIVYRPLETPLLKSAREQGLTAIDGLGMLIHQGARAFEIWFGIKPDAGKARQRLMATLA